MIGNTIYYVLIINCEEISVQMTADKNKFSLRIQGKRIYTLMTFFKNQFGNFVGGILFDCTVNRSY